MIESAKALSSARFDCQIEDIIVMYLSKEVNIIEKIAAAFNRFCQKLLDIVKYVAKIKINVCVYAVIDDALFELTFIAFSQALFIDLRRIIVSKHPDL